MRCIVIIFLLLSSSTFGVSFQDNLKLLLDNDANLTQEKQYLEYYEATKKSGYSRFLPSVALNSIKSYQKYEGSTRTQTNRNSLDLSLDLFKFGQDFFYLQSNNSLYKAQENKIKSQLLQSEVTLSDLLFRYIELKNDIEIREDILKLKDKAHSVAQARYNAGQLSLQDLQKVEIDLNNSMAQIENQVMALSSLLINIANYGDVENMDIAWPWENKLANIEGLSEQKLKLGEHPSYNYSRFNTEALRYQKKGVISSLFGNLNLTYSKGETEDLETNYFYNDERVILSFTFPLFENFNSWSSYKKAVADEYTGRLNFRNTERFLEESIKSMQQNLKAALRTYRLRNQTLKLSTKLFTNSLNQFQKGRLSVNDLILDQDRLLQTKLLANSGSSTLHQSIVNLCQALGKSIQGECFPQ